MKKYNITGVPIIFPKYTCALYDLGYEVEVLGRKATDNKLSQYLLLFITGELTLDELPDICVYNTQTKVWKSMKVDERICLERDGFSNSYYFPNLDTRKGPTVIRCIENIIHEFSSATLKLEVK